MRREQGALQSISSDSLPAFKVSTLLRWDLPGLSSSSEVQAGQRRLEPKRASPYAGTSFPLPKCAPGRAGGVRDAVLALCHREFPPILFSRQGQRAILLVLPESLMWWSLMGLQANANRAQRASWLQLPDLGVQSCNVPAAHAPSWPASQPCLSAVPSVSGLLGQFVLWSCFQSPLMPNRCCLLRWRGHAPRQGDQVVF